MLGLKKGLEMSLTTFERTFIASIRSKMRVLKFFRFARFFLALIMRFYLPLKIVRFRFFCFVRFER